MPEVTKPEQEPSWIWAEEWLEGVADGSKAMSQRKLTSVEKHGGGLEAIKVVAEAKGVHFLVVKDDHGEPLVAASVNLFKVIC